VLRGLFQAHFVAKQYRHYVKSQLAHFHCHKTSRNRRGIPALECVDVPENHILSGSHTLTVRWWCPRMFPIHASTPLPPSANDLVCVDTLDSSRAASVSNLNDTKYAEGHQMALSVRTTLGTGESSSWRGPARLWILCSAVRSGGR
jgi:hypothetical protein